MYINKTVQSLLLIFLFVAPQPSLSGQLGFNGAIDTEGTIIDAETGEGIEGVRLVITKSRFTLLAESFRSSKTERRSVDGSYQVKCSNCSSIRVLFFADGYHSEVRTFEKKDKRNSNTVSLRPVGNAVTVIEYRGRLVVNQEEEKNRIFPVSSRPRAASSLELAQQYAAKNGEPLLYVRLLTELDEKGAPLSMPQASVHSPNLPVSAIMDFTAAEGGVVPYEPHATVQREIHREMILAPVDGYQPQLVLDPTLRGSTWFYVRIGARYGRGRAFTPSLESTENGQRLVVTFQLFLNPNGSRNLETVE